MGIAKITAVDLLDKSDTQTIMSLSSELEEAFTKKEQWRTEFLARNSVLNNVSFPSIASKYWQSVREQDAFFNALIHTAIEHKKTLAERDILECELLEIKGKTKKANALRNYKEAEIEEKNYAILVQKHKAHHRVREIGMWQKIKNEMVAKDPSFDRTNPNTHQAETFKKRWELEMKVGAQMNHADLYRHAKSNLETMINDD